MSETPKEPQKEESKAKRHEVTIDTSVVDVLRMDKEGYDLFFVDTIEEFKQLLPGEMNILSQKNRERYRASLGLYKVNCEERANPSPTDNLSTYGRQVAPRSRCYIQPETKLPGYTYSMINPKTLHDAKRAGAEVCTKETDPQLIYSNMSDGKDGILQVGEPGNISHIIVRYKKEDYHNNVELPPAKKSQERCQIVEEETAEQMKKGGGNSLKLKELAGKKFRTVGE